MSGIDAALAGAPRARAHHLAEIVVRFRELGIVLALADRRRRHRRSTTAASSAARACSSCSRAPRSSRCSRSARRS